jgi:hypothetical protein
MLTVCAINPPRAVYAAARDERYLSLARNRDRRPSSSLGEDAFGLSEQADTFKDFSVTCVLGPAA